MTGQILNCDEIQEQCGLHDDVLSVEIPDGLVGHVEWMCDLPKQTLNLMMAEQDERKQIFLNKINYVLIKVKCN